MNGVEFLRPMKAKEKRDKTKIRWNGQAMRRAAVRNGPMAGAFFLFSLSSCLSVPSPFAVCCLMAALRQGLPEIGAAAGLTLGLLFRLLWAMPMDPSLFAACAACFALCRAPVGKEWHGYLLALSALLLRAVPQIAVSQETQSALLAAFGMLLGMAVMPALFRSAKLIRHRPAEWTEDDLLCLMLPVFFLLNGLCCMHLFQVNLGCLAASAFVLLLSWTAGGGFAVSGALGCGLALLLGGQGAVPLITLSFGALTAGLFQGKIRLLPAGVFLLSAAAMIYLVSPAFQTRYFTAHAAGAAVFALLPPPWAKKAAAWVRMLRWVQPRENAYTRLKMRRWVRSIERLASSLPHPSLEMPTEAEECEGITEALCAGCQQLPVCWHEKAEETRSAVRALSQRGKEAENYLPLINQYFSFCPRISRLPAILYRLDEEKQQRKKRMLCAEYERDMLSTHLTALSQAIQRISLEGEQADGEESRWIALADEALQKIHFPGRTAFVKKKEGHFAVGLQFEAMALRPLTGFTLARQVGTYLGADLEVTEKRSDRLLLEERPPLKAVTGMATACAVTIETKRRPGEEPDNGDAVLVEELSGGKVALAVSDGMGHGRDAQAESRKTLEMLSLCLDAGYTRSQAMTAVNGAMLSAAGGEKFATVDLCVIDLWTGDAAMNKLGASPSILVQGQKAQWIQGEALPLGIIEQITPMEHRFTLGEGDLLILMSDGISDAFPEEEDVLSVVRRNLRKTPQQLSDALLREAVMQRDGLPPDDMTVLCARIMDVNAPEE